MSQAIRPSRADADPVSLATRFARSRALSEALAAPLSDADATIQSMEDASPAKWHLAHTSWFYETFLLRENIAGRELYNPRFPYLFNSYYEAEGERIDRFSRGMLSRPTLDEVLDFRRAVTEEMAPLLERDECAQLIALGIAHEEQHQELLLTDIKHALFQNPLGPAMFAQEPEPTNEGEEGWFEHPGGIARIGHDGEGFAFDCEGPRHRLLLEPFLLSRALVTNRQWADFIADGGYREPRWWLSDGWAWVRREDRSAPLYWRDDQQFTLSGWRGRDPDAPVTHLSYYEADAFAAWADATCVPGARLPTEAEWEAIAEGHDPAGGQQLDAAGPVRPEARSGLFGSCWQWTRSAYLPYPGFRPAEGAVGEYNGKFMAGQFVLKGGSCATVRGHMRRSYRNFFYPHQQWQFSGLRLARDV